MRTARSCAVYCSVILALVAVIGTPGSVEAGERVLTDTVLIPGGAEYYVEIDLGLNDRLVCYSDTGYETPLRLSIANPDGTLRLMSTSTQGSEYTEYYYVVVRQMYGTGFDADSEGTYRMVWENAGTIDASLNYTVVNAGYVPPENDYTLVNAAIIGLGMVVVIETAMVALLLISVRKMKRESARQDNKPE
ncbi:MAG: hypothetical protein MUO87_08390 [Thermoplasmata archaeon]|nr:hypothetical protein [Thermoplasmata archaeon]